MDRSGGRASTTGMDGVIGVLRSGDLLGIYPEGTRSPDGRLYKGKTGVARIVMRAGVPVIPVGMINTELVPSRFFKIPTMRRPKIRIGKPMDFSAYAEAGNDRDVLRWITDEIMNAVMELSGQEYVDAYGTAAKTALEGGKALPPSAGHRPGAGRPTPPVPAAKSAARCATCDGCERVSEGEERSTAAGRETISTANSNPSPARPRPQDAVSEDLVSVDRGGTVTVESGSGAGRAVYWALKNVLLGPVIDQDLPPDP